MQLSLGMADYGLIMAILNKNLSEGASEFPPAQEPEQKEIPSRSGTYSINPSRLSQLNSDTMHQSSKAYDKLKFNFQFDGVTINLLEGNFAKYGMA